MREIKRFEDLLGETIINFRIVKDVDYFRDEKEEIIITLKNKRRFKLHHLQDCCEQVYIEDITGDFSDLIGLPLLIAEEATNEKGQSNNLKMPEHHDESWTWTFYKLSTNRGSVTIRWFGTSNGYYSESVDFVEI